MKLKSKTTLYSVLLAVWLLVVAGFLIYPLWGRIKGNSAQLQEKQRKVAELKTQSRQLNSLQQSLGAAESDFEIIDNLFVNNEAPVEFLEFLEQTAADTEVDININPAAGEKSDEPWPPTFFRVSGTGSFGECTRFITKLEYAPYLIEIQSLTLEKVEGEEGETQEVKVNLLIKAY